MPKEEFQPQLGDWLEHTDFMYNDRKMKGQVVTVDHNWGWFEVKWEDGRYYQYHSNKMVRPTKSPQEERADARLKEESLGITDDWREYDGEEV